MTNYTYKEIQKKAKECVNNLKKYKTGIGDDWTYYLAKAILNPKKDIKKISMKKASNPQQDSISRGISKKDYTSIAKKYVEYVEKHEQIPNYLTYKNLKISPLLLKAFFAKIIVNNYPDKQNINNKWFTKPSETGNVVYDYWVKKFKFSPKTMDEILKYVSNHFTYQYYFDDQKSNKQVIDTKSGNCTDLLQMLVNMLKKLGYDVIVLHVQCRKSGTGHVRLMARHKKYTENEWVYRDIACVADGGSITCNWCMDGILLAKNPSWFMQNLNR